MSKVKKWKLDEEFTSGIIPNYQRKYSRVQKKVQVNTFSTSEKLKRTWLLWERSTRERKELKEETVRERGKRELSMFRKETEHNNKTIEREVTLEAVIARIQSMSN